MPALFHKILCATASAALFTASFAGTAAADPGRYTRNYDSRGAFWYGDDRGRHDRDDWRGRQDGDWRSRQYDRNDWRSRHPDQYRHNDWRRGWSAVQPLAAPPHFIPPPPRAYGRYVSPPRYRIGSYYQPGRHTHVIRDYRRYGLYDPPRGHHWVRDDYDDDALLVSIATGAVIGLVVGVIASQY